MDINSLFNLHDDYLPDNLKFFKDGVLNCLSVIDGQLENTYVIENIVQSNSGLYSNVDVEIKSDNTQLIGILCYKNLGVDYDIESMTIWKYISYLLDSESLEVTGNYRFNRSYIYIKKEFYEEYCNCYRDGAAIWGGFIHENTLSVQTYSSPAEITLDRILNIPTDIQKDKLKSAVLSQNAFDRFLKKYQMLELMYDYNCVLKLRTVDEGLSNFREIMSEYSNSELPSLKSLAKDYVGDISPYITIIHSDFISNIQLSEKIFQIEAKDGNPFKKGEWNKFIQLVESSNLDYTSGLQKRRSISYKHSLDVDSYSKLILDIVCYWLYRIRCSIAHFKLGEYILGHSEEKYLIEFCEPLLDQLVSDIYSNEQLKKMLNVSNTMQEIINNA